MEDPGKREQGRTLRPTAFYKGFRYATPISRLRRIPHKTCFRGGVLCFAERDGDELLLGVVRAACSGKCTGQQLYVIGHFFQSRVFGCFAVEFLYGGQSLI